MKQLNPACSSLFFRRLVLFSILLLSFSFAHGQCPIPYPKGDLDSTLRNQPVSTVVTRNDITAFGSGAPLIPDTLYVSTQPAHGTVTIVNDSTITYTPDPGYVGTDFYTYTVCNACHNCATASVSIEVKALCPAPKAINDYYTVYNNMPTTLNVLNNDTNLVGGPLSINVTQQPLHGGTATVVGSNIMYHGNGSYIGQDTLIYLICDTCTGNSCALAYVYLNVIACLPVHAQNDTGTVMQGNAISVNVLANDTNSSGFGTATISIISTPHFGSYTTIVGSNVVYRAGGLGFGTDSVLYQVCTDCGCDTAMMILNVTQAPCTKPTAVIDNEYAGYLSTCTNTYNILGNDIIPINSGTLIVTIVTPPAFGTAVIINNKLVYTCTDSTKKGQIDLVRYSVCNACFCDTGTVAITISNYPCNGLNPIINSDTARVCRNYPVNINVTANDVDPEGGIVSVDTVVGAPIHGTAVKLNSNYITYTPAANYTGHDYFVYQACDNGTPKLCNINTVDVYVLDCNTSPIILNTGGHETDTLHISVYEDSSRNYCFTYTQADSPYVHITSISTSLDTVTPTAGSTVPGTQPCVYIAPPKGSRAGDTVQVIICNNYPLCDTVDLIISVIPVDHAPVARPDVIHYTGPSCNGINVLTNDSDPDPADRIHISHFDSTTIHGGTITQINDSTLCYQPDSFYVGVDSFAYTICDTSGLCSTSYVTVTIPLLARDDQATIAQDQTVTINVKANDARAYNEYITLCSMPLHGTAVIDSAGVEYTPVHDYPINPINPDTTIAIGLDSFCYTLCSVEGTDTTCVNAEVYISIMPKGRFYIPQGISPNGDGINDKFVIVSSDEFPKSQLLVYNRYGDEVWRNDGDGYLNDFDGTWKKNGQPLPDMSYWYIFKFNDGVHADQMGYIIIER